MKEINLKRFKKVASDKHSSTLMHDDGHSLKIAHKHLSSKLMSELDKLPMHKNVLMAAQGVDTEDYGVGGGPGGGNIGVDDNLPVQNQDETNEEYDKRVYPSEANKKEQPTAENASFVSKDKSSDDSGLDSYQKGLLSRWESEGKIPAGSAAKASLPKRDNSEKEYQAGLVKKWQDAGQLPGLAPTQPQQSEPAQEQPEQPEQPVSAPQQAAPQEAPEQPVIKQDEDLKQQDLAFKQDLANGHLNQFDYKDPNTGNIIPLTYHDLFAKKDTLGKISSIFGLLLSGAGSGLAHQPNLVMQMMDNEINNDLNAQEKSRANSINFLKLAQEKELQGAQIKNIGIDTKIKTRAEAENMATRTALHNQVEKVKRMPPGPPRQAAEQLLMFMGQSVDAKNSSLADRAAAMMAMYNMGGGEDPSALVRMKVPEHLQPKVFEEIKNAQDVKAIAPSILDAFDKAASGVGLVDFIPGMENADQKRFLSLINTTIKDLEGTARQAAFDSIEKNMKPQFGDSDGTIANKRQSVKEYMTSKSAAPVAKGFGIDLDRYGTTSHSQIRQDTYELKQPGTGRIGIYDSKTNKPLRWK